MKLILQFLKPYKALCIGAFLAVTCDVAGALLIPTITANMINIGVTDRNMDMIIQNGFLMLIISVVTGLAALAGSFLCARLSAGVGRDLRNAVYDKSLELSETDFEEFGTASMITRTLSDITNIQDTITMFVQMVLPVPVMCVLGVIFSFRISTHMGYLILSVMAFVTLLTTLIVGKAAPIMEKLQRAMDRMNIVLRENITGVRVIRAFNKEAHETGRMTDSFSGYASLAISANRLFAALDSLATVAINLCIVAILYIGANNVGAGSMQIGDISAVTEYAVWILFYLIMAQMVIIMMPKAIVCMRRISAVLTHEPEITDGDSSGVGRAGIAVGTASTTGKAGITGDTAPATGKSGAADGSVSATDNSEIAGGTVSAAGSDIVIRFDHVTFRFADADENTLSDISFSCRRGETTAIIGGTGSGKSTIAKLALRYHDVKSGSIQVCGTNIKDMPQSSLRNHISYVPQKAWLFSGTIADNLRYGDESADDETLLHAIHTAQSDFVLELPNGLKARVAQGGTNFSGGQRQRLAIARALVKKADMYIFDDSFSALDFKTDAALRHALECEPQIQSAAVLIIAQRVSTIAHADRIIVLGDGRIEGIGTHEYLLENCDVYRDIVDSQSRQGK